MPSTLAAGVWLVAVQQRTQQRVAPASTASPRTYGRYQAALSVARSGGLAAGPALGVFAYSAWVSLPWLGSGVLGIIAIALFTLFLRDLPKMDDPSPSAARCT